MKQNESNNISTDSFSFGGYVHVDKPKETGKTIRARYEEIKHLQNEIEIERTPGYAHMKFKSTPLTDAARELSARDILILADSGNLCFGGSCRKAGDHFAGRYNTD